MLTDEQIGRNLAEWRGGRSQKDLAGAMRELGFKWSQATVWSIEKGERPLRLAEAEALAEVMGEHNFRLLTRSDAGAAAFSAGAAAKNAWDDLMTSMRRFDEARIQLALALDSVPPEDQTGVLGSLGESWVEMTLEDALSEYRQEDHADYIREKIASGMTDEEEAAIDARQQGSWIGRLNEVNSKVRVDDGERQAAP